MAIQETLNGSATSAEVNPIAVISEFTVEMTDGVGRVTLEYKAPGASRWVAVATNINNGSVSTPDSAYLYRFRSTNVVNVKVYFGP